MMDASFRLKAMLRICAAVCLLALGTAIMPRGWMEQTHRWLGLGPLPEGPVFEYLARSISLLYAGMGFAAWMLATDIVRYGRLIRCYGGGYIAFGVMLMWTDWRVGLPVWWAAGEGPFAVLVGVAIVIMNEQAGRLGRSSAGAAVGCGR